MLNGYEQPRPMEPVSFQLLLQHAARAAFNSHPRFGAMPDNVVSVQSAAAAIGQAVQAAIMATPAALRDQSAMLQMLAKSSSVFTPAQGTITVQVNNVVDQSMAIPPAADFPPGFDRVLSRFSVTFWLQLPASTLSQPKANAMWCL